MRALMLLLALTAVLATAQAGSSSNPEGFTCSSGPQTEISNWNGSGVTGEGRAPTVSTGGAYLCLDSIATYHLSGGSAGGTISLTQGGTTLGPYTADVQAATPGFFNWVATPPADTVITGDYTCNDSDPSSWGQNAESNGFGFCKVFVRQALDNTAPSVSMTSPAAGDKLHGTVRVVLTATDLESGIDHLDLQTSAPGADSWVTRQTLGPGALTWDTTGTPDGAYDVRLVAVNGTGGSASTTPVAVEIDNTMPTIDVRCDGNPCAPWYVDAPVNVTAVAADANGVGQLTYSVGGPFGAQPYTGAIPVSQTTTLTFDVSDSFGNLQLQTVTIGVDTTPPPAPQVVLAAPSSFAYVHQTRPDGYEIFYNPSAGTQQATLAVPQDDDPQSGIASVDFPTSVAEPGWSVTGTTATTATFEWAPSFSVGPSFSIVSTNGAGQTSPTTDVGWTVDPNAPTGGIACDPAGCGNTGGPVSVTVSMNDAGQSGVKQVRYTIDGSTPSATHGIVAGATTSFSLNRAATVQVWAVDNVGNETAPGTLTAAVSGTPAAGSFTVTSPADTDDANAGDGVCADASGACTLRAAVGEANALPAGSAITVPAGSYALTAGALTIQKGMTIAGAGARSTSVIGVPSADRATTGERVFDVAAAADAVTISGLTVSGGTATPTNEYFGGDVRNKGNLTLRADTVTNGSAYSGGGVSNAGGTLLIDSSTITGNAAAYGGADSGGVQNWGDGTHHGALTIVNSTISGNTAGIGGGVFSWNDSANTVVIRNSTIVGNTAADIGGVGLVDGSSTSIAGSVVSGNSGNGVRNNCGGTVTSLGHNLESAADCGFIAAGDIRSTDPLLGPLADNGGPTDTMLPAPGSPLLDAGDNTACPSVDQRGTTRPQGSTCDIGAVEAAIVAPPSDPHIDVSVSNDWVSLHGWVPNDSVAITIGDNHVGDITTDAFGNAFAASVGAHDFAPGETVVAGDGIRSTTIVLDDLTVGATTFAEATMTASGTAPPNRSYTYTVTSSTGALLDTLTGTTSPTGTWVDTSPRRPLPLNIAIAMPYGSSGNSTYAGTFIEKPAVDASITGDWISLHGWPANTPLTVQTGTTVLHATTDDAGDAALAKSQVGVDLQPGTTIFASGDGLSTSLTLAALTMNRPAVGGTQVSGSAPQNSVVQVALFDMAHPGSPAITETNSSNTGTDTAWSATLGTAIAYGQSVQARLDDGNGNGTVFEQNFFQPTIQASLTHGWISLLGWPADQSITVTVTGQDPRVVTAGGDGNVAIQNAGPLAPGTTITAVSGNLAKTLVLEPLAVDTQPVGSTVYSGTAPPGRPVKVWLFAFNSNGQPPIAEATALADAVTGSWTVTLPATTRGESIQAHLTDPDGDDTVAELGFSPLNIDASLTTGSVQLNNWPGNTLVTVSANGHSAQAATDAGGAAFVAGSALGATLHPGDVVSASDAVGDNDQLVLGTVGIVSLDATSNRAAGFATTGAGAIVSVCANQGPTFLGCENTTTGARGLWTLTFTAFQIAPGMRLSAHLQDGNGNATSAELDLAPTVAIDSSASVYGGDGTAFSFHSPTQGAVFQCSVDGAAPTSCTSPYTEYVSSGAHTFSVQAGTNNVFGTAATQSFTAAVPAPGPTTARIDVAANQPLGPLDSGIGESLAAGEILQATCAKLMNYPDQPAPTGVLVQPEVAAGPPTVSSDGLTYTFVVRSGFAFADGSPVTAQSYKDALDRVRDPALNGATADGLTAFAGIASTSVDGNALTITLSAPNYGLPELLASSFACPVPAGTPHTPVASEPGSGPYTIASITGDRVTLTANPHYGGVRPHAFGEIDLDLGVDPAAGEARVLAGESDSLAGSPPTEAPESSQLVTGEFGLQLLSLNTAKAPFNDVNLRKAVNLAVDRAALSRLSAPGSTGGPATAQLLSPGQPGYQNWNVYPTGGPDLAQAKADAALAGVDATRRVTVQLFTTAGNPSRDAMAHEIQTDLAVIGVDVVINEIPGDRLFGPTVPGGPDDMRLFAYVLAGADPDGIFQAIVGANNFSNFSDRTVAARLAAAEATPAPSRYDQYSTLDRDLLQTYAPVVPLNTPTAKTIFSSRIAAGSRIFNPAAFGVDLAALSTAKIVTTTADSGPGSLRQAIVDANTQAGPDAIRFNIPGNGVQTITLQSPLPQIVDPVSIDGSTQPGYAGAPLVAVDGSLAGGDGLSITADDSTVRGLVVEGFAGIGVHVFGDRDTIAASYLGLDPGGALAAGNGGDGIRIEGGDGDVVGGPGLADGNLVGGNGGHGIFLDGATNVTVTGNVSGLDAAQDAAVPNGLDGIAVDGGSGNTITANVASGNTNQGISLFGVFFPVTTGNVVRGNWVGVDRGNTTEIGNGVDGIRVFNGSGNTIGGTGALQGNIVAGNGGAGIDVLGTSAHNTISGNAVTDDGGLGIDLGGDGVTADDNGDGDSGPNGLQNFPVITAADGSHVAGSLNSIGNGTYTIEVFDSPACDTSGNGEAAGYLGTVTAHTDDSGNASWSLPTENVPAGTAVTATATSAAGDTSELSACSQTQAAILNLAVTVDQSSASVGASSISLASLPPQLFQQLAGAPNAAPIPSAPIPSAAVGAAPIPSAPIPSAPIPSAPIPSAPIPSAPIPSAPIPSAPIPSAGLAGLPIPSAAAPNPLDSVLLSSLPGLDSAALFVGTSLEGKLPQQYTLGDVYRTPLALTRFEATYTVSDLPLNQTLLRGVGTLSFLLGGKPLGEIHLPGGQSWCAALLAAGGSCANVDLTKTTVIGLDIMRQLGTLATTLGGLTVADLGGLNGTLVGQAYLARIALQQTTIANIPVASLANASHFVSCTTCATLGDAANAHAVNDEVPLQDLGAALNGVTLNELVVALTPRSAFPWESESFVGWQGFAGQAPQLQYHVDFDVRCPVTTVSVRVTLPFGFLYVPGSSTAAAGPGSAAAIADPALDPKTGATWSGLAVTPCTPGSLQHLRLNFKGEPGFRLGGSPTQASVTADGASGKVTGAPVDVQRAWTAALSRSTEPTIAKDTIVLSHIDHAGGTNYFRLPEVGRGEQVTIYMKPPAGADYDLYVVRPSPSTLLASPIPSAPIPSAPIPSAPIPSAPIPSASTSVNTSTDNPAPELLDDGPLPGGEIAVDSITRGDGVEALTFRQAGTSGFDEIAVAGYNGASSPQPFELRVAEQDPAPLPSQCPARTFANGAPQQVGTLPLSLPATTKALALVNVGRMRAMYDPAKVATMLTDLDQALAAAGGAVLKIDGDNGVFAAANAWDQSPCSTDASNAYVKAINTLVARYRGSLPNLSSITIVGDDEQIPFARVPDFVPTSNELDNTGALAYQTHGGTTDNATFAAAALGYVLTDDAYGAFHTRTLFGHEFFLPEVALGRLVETPTEIDAQLAQFLGTPDRTLHPTTGLVTGYDFMSDGARAVSAALAGRIGAAGTATSSLLDDAWGPTALTQFFTGTQTPGIDSWNAHYDAYRLMPATYTGPTDLLSTALLTTPHFDGSIFFTMGCHAGESIDDTIAADATKAFDWAQAYARNGAAVFVGNTGFGYGDTASVALSERLMTIFAGHLAFTGSVGEKFLQSKNEYFATMGDYGPFDEKAIEEATFYGLPFWSVNSPVEPPPTPPALHTDPATGLQQATLTITPSLTQVSDPRGTFWKGGGGTVFVPGHSLQPLETKDVSEPATGLVAHGFFPSALVTEDRKDVNLYFAKPMIDLGSHEPEPLVTNEVFPASPVKLAQTDYLGARHSMLEVTTGQARPGSTPSLQNERLTTSIQGDVTYAPASATDYAPPQFSQAGAVVAGGQATIFATVTDDSAGGVTRVRAFYTTGGPWVFADLQPVPGVAGAWRATVPVGAAKIEAGFVAEDGSGNTGWMTAKGNLLESVTPASTQTTITIQSPLDGGSYTVKQPVSAAYTCSSATAIAACAGDAPNGGAVDTAAVGQKHFTVTATPLAGNASSKTAAYSVVYAFAGFQSPITTQTGFNTGNGGSTIPIKFSLHGNFGTAIFPPGYPQVGPIPCTGGTVATGAPAQNVGGGLQYDARSDTYQWNWKTDKAFTGCYQLVVALNDGSLHRLNFTFKGDLRCVDEQLPGVWVNGNLVVTPGHWCDLVNATVTGNVVAAGTTGLRVQGSTIGGNLQVAGTIRALVPSAPGVEQVCNSSVHGDVQIAGSLPVAPWNVGGCGGNTIGGNLQFAGNLARTNVVAGNRVQGSLQCLANGAVSGGSNVAGGLIQGQCTATHG